MAGGWEEGDEGDKELVRKADWYEWSELMELFDLDRVPMSWLDEEWA